MASTAADSVLPTAGCLLKSFIADGLHSINKPISDQRYFIPLHKAYGPLLIAISQSNEE